MRVITLGSGKGGTGKSFLAANLGIALARRGVKTCLVDLDLGCADLNLLLGLLEPPRRSVLEVLRGGSGALRDVMVPADAAGHLHLVPGSSETVRAAGLTGREIAQLASGLRELPVEMVIVDLAAGVGHQVLDLLLASDLQLIVTTPDPLSLSDAARLLGLARLRCSARTSGSIASVARPRVYTSLDELVRDLNAVREEDIVGRGGASFRPALVLNRVKPDGGLSASELLANLRGEVGGKLDLPLLAEVPEDPAVERSVRLLEPLANLAPASAASRAIADLAAYLAGEGGIPESPIIAELALASLPNLA